MIRNKRVVRSKRAGARREVLRRLKEIKESVILLQDWWKVPGTIHSGSYCARKEHEYPENQRRYWASTIAEIDDLGVALTTFREYCLEQYRLTPEE